MSQYYQLDIEIIDTSLPSLISGLKEILDKLETDINSQIEPTELTYKGKYDEGKHNGEYKAKLKVI